MSLPYSPEEIEQYVAGEMNAKQAERFTKELSVNSALRAEAQLYNQVNKAIRELDINYLRQKLTDLMAMETSWNVSEEIIEGFIDGRLEGEELEKFRAEYNENTGLKAEVKLRKELNEAVGEKDIIELKEKLQAIHKDAKTKEIKSLIPNHKKKVSIGGEPVLLCPDCSDLIFIIPIKPIRHFINRLNGRIKGLLSERILFLLKQVNIFQKGTLFVL